MKLFRRKKVSAHHSPTERKFILGDDTSFVVDEAYNTLRSNLIFSLTGKGCKVIEFTSCGMSDGKSINVLNTAITFAETNAKVLLIDCDLRRPNISRLLSHKSSPGLTNVLVNASTLDESIVRLDDYNMDVLFAGYLPPNPSELLTSDALAELMSTLKERYDYIFIDTPPVAAVIDAAVIAKYTDGAVVVVRPGSVKKEELVNVVNQLEFADAKVIGFILNGIDVEDKGYSHRSGYKYTYAYVNGSENPKAAKNAKGSAKHDDSKKNK
ncbi:MAG: CpsD/CapB family tyrosine-protein kinase [Acutalibacteraceae bacterium]